MGFILPIEDFLKKNTIEDPLILITAYSYEDRSIESTKKITETIQIEETIIIQYDIEVYLDSETLKKWERNKETIKKLLNKQKIKFKTIDCHHDSTSALNNILDIVDKNKKFIIDITCFTKNYILKLAQLFEMFNVFFFYTRSKDIRPLTTHESSVSIDRIEPVEGFEGFMEINKKDLIVLLLGFEGNRALAFLSKYETEPIYVLISSPFFKDNQDNDWYIKTAEDSNKQLLNIHRVFEFNENIHSLEPFAVAEEINRAIQAFDNLNNYNLCLSCLGTKLQTLGLYIYWKSHPTSQLLYTIPIKRYDFSTGAGTSYIINLKNIS